MDTVLVAGAGSWGTALAMILARNGCRILLWGHRPEHIAALKRDNANTSHFPGVPFPANLIPMDDLSDALSQTSEIIVAVPCVGLRSFLHQVRSHSHGALRVCCSCKGFEPGTGKLSHQVILDVLGVDVPRAALSGPTFAGEVVAGQPSAAVIAASDELFARHLVGRFHSDTFRAYSSGDLIGVEVGGAVKNVLAIAAGVAAGLGFGANTLAALVTRGLSEMSRFGVACGGEMATFMGLAGLGDLLLTCTDNQSRNRRLGLALADGIALKDAYKSVGQVVEGARTAGEVAALAAELGVEMPITQVVTALLRGDYSAAEAVGQLLARAPKEETGSA